MRWVGCLLIGSSIILWGFHQAARQEEKLHVYWRLKQRLQTMIRIVQQGGTLREALAQGNSEEPDCWERIAEKMERRTGEGFEEIWQQEVKKERDKYSKEELEHLLSLGRILAGQDREGCCRQLEYMREYIEKREEEEGKELRERGRLYRRLGILGGILTAIFFI